MISSEVKRTLVKSAPELWSELSDPEALARHLGDFGDVRITHVEPEQTVEWEATGSSGTVQLKSSGWGTKVTLSVRREIALEEEEPEPQAETVKPEAAEVSPSEQQDGELGCEGETLAEMPAVALVQPGATDPVEDGVPVDAEIASPEDQPLVGEIEAVQGEPQSALIPQEPQAQLTSTVEVHEQTSDEDPLETAPSEEPQRPTRRRRLWTKLFGRSRSQTPPEPSDSSPPLLDAVEEQAVLQSAAGETTTGDLPQAQQPQTSGQAIEEAQDNEPDEPEIDSDADVQESPEPAAEDPLKAPGEPPQPAAELSAELAELEAQMTEQSAAVLTAVLDRLGAAHHRPFSRG
ncbi:MAG TPA: hypothetical protein VID48_08970 [Solirubrobacteraceae bacterium]|jgi:hypothetical protein